MAKVNWINGSIEPPEPGAYLNDDNAHDCARCKLGDCRWRGRFDRGIHCPKNTYGEWIHRPPQVI